MVERSELALETGTSEMTDADTRKRYADARRIATIAGVEALRYFGSFKTLKIDRKGHQDLVSEGDRNVESLVSR